MQLPTEKSIACDGTEQLPALDRTTQRATTARASPQGNRNGTTGD